ncbi:hypothetical protein Droror1_Dr00009952 [Drosera rotundifolia]
MPTPGDIPRGEDWEGSAEEQFAVSGWFLGMDLNYGRFDTYLSIPRLDLKRGVCSKKRWKSRLLNRREVPLKRDAGATEARRWCDGE